MAESTRKEIKARLTPDELARFEAYLDSHPRSERPSQQDVIVQALIEYMDRHQRFSESVPGHRIAEALAFLRFMDREPSPDDAGTLGLQAAMKTVLKMEQKKS